MAKLLYKGFLLVAVNAALGIALLAAVDAGHRYAPWETDSLLEVMPRDTHFGLVILGSSHAYILSRLEEHHAILERELGMAVMNLALPTGGGIRPARLFLEQFLAQGNRADHVLICADPFVFFGTGPNDQHKFVYYEPLRLSFLWRLVRDGYPLRRIFVYVRSKFSWDWLMQHAEPMTNQPLALTGPIDAQRVALRIDSLYTEGLNATTFAHYAPELDRILADCQRADAAAHILVMPTLLGEEPGAEAMTAYVSSLQDRFAFTFDDLANAMPHPAYYCDLDHLNTAGVQHFVHTYLKPLMTQ